MSTASPNGRSHSLSQWAESTASPNEQSHNLSQWAESTDSPNSWSHSLSQWAESTASPNERSHILSQWAESTMGGVYRLSQWAESHPLPMGRESSFFGRVFLLSQLLFAYAEARDNASCPHHLSLPLHYLRTGSVTGSGTRLAASNPHLLSLPSAKLGLLVCATTAAFLHSSEEQTQLLVIAKQNPVTH